MEAFFSILFTVIIGVPFTYAVLQVIAEIRAETRREKKIEATRRIESVDGKEYSVVTKNLPFAREKNTGRIGIVMGRGGERDPTTINGQLTFEPRWIQVQFVRKKDGKAGKTEWRRFRKFEVLGTTDVDFLTRRTGFFSHESIIRYNSKFWLM